MNTRPDILQYDLPGLEALLVEHGQKKYRAKQLAEWIYLRNAPDFDHMDTLPRALRNSLEKQISFVPPKVLQRFCASDKTTRYLLELGDGEKTEVVAIPSAKRLTVCFSTQVGCALGCTFCATGSLGLHRSLLPGEMLYQLSIVAADFPEARVSNVVAMGQGEPFANYEATLAALRMMNSPQLFGIGARHITVSTAGMVRQIRRFAAEPEQFTLAVSLHSAEQRVRDSLMPGLASQPLDALREALLFYMKTTSRRPSLEYALAKDVNDTRQALASLLAFCDVPAPGFHVNLIPLNTSSVLAPNSASDNSSSNADCSASNKSVALDVAALKKSDNTALHIFEQGLERAGVSVSRRVSRGASIAAACGQLASQA